MYEKRIGATCGQFVNNNTTICIAFVTVEMIVHNTMLNHARSDKKKCGHYYFNPAIVPIITFQHWNQTLGKKN